MEEGRPLRPRREHYHLLPARRMVPPSPSSSLSLRKGSTRGDATVASRLEVDPVVRSDSWGTAFVALLSAGGGFALGAMITNSTCEQTVWWNPMAVWRLAALAEQNLLLRIFSPESVASLHQVSGSLVASGAGVGCGALGLLSCAAGPDSRAGRGLRMLRCLLLKSRDHQTVTDQVSKRKCLDRDRLLRRIVAGGYDDLDGRPGRGRSDRRGGGGDDEDGDVLVDLHEDSDVMRARAPAVKSRARDDDLCPGATIRIFPPSRSPSSSSPLTSSPSPSPSRFSSLLSLGSPSSVRPDRIPVVFGLPPAAERPRAKMLCGASPVRNQLGTRPTGSRAGALLRLRDPMVRRTHSTLRLVPPVSREYLRFLGN